jgi:hypothetical protein
VALVEPAKVRCVPLPCHRESSGDARSLQCRMERAFTQPCQCARHWSLGRGPSLQCHPPRNGHPPDADGRTGAAHGRPSDLGGWTAAPGGWTSGAGGWTLALDGWTFVLDGWTLCLNGWTFDPDDLLFWPIRLVDGRVRWRLGAEESTGAGGGGGVGVRGAGRRGASRGTKASRHPAEKMSVAKRLRPSMPLMPQCLSASVLLRATFAGRRAARPIPFPVRRFCHRQVV